MPHPGPGLKTGSFTTAGNGPVRPRSLSGFALRLVKNALTTGSYQQNRAELGSKLKKFDRIASKHARFCHWQAVETPLAWRKMSKPDSLLVDTDYIYRQIVKWKRH